MIFLNTGRRTVIAGRIDLINEIVCVEVAKGGALPAAVQ
jgi:hypothetical protein